MNLTIEGTKENNRQIGKFDGDECVSHGYKKHTMKFRLFPIPSYTGVCKNGNFVRPLMNAVYDRVSHYYSRSNFTVGGVRELYEKCPHGNTCKILEIPVYVRTAKKVKDQIIWIENERY